MTATHRPIGRAVAALLSFSLAVSCGDPGPYGYGNADDASDAHQAHATSSKSVIRGEIAWPGAAPPAGFACVFLEGRSTPDARLPQLLQRLPAGPFPLAFELSARDLLGPGTLSGEWFLTARLDRDGTVLAQSGDVRARTARAVGVGSAGVVLSLDEQVAQDDDPALLRELALSGASGAVLSPPSPTGMPSSGALPTGHPPIPSASDPRAGAASAPASGNGTAAAAAQQPPKMPGPRFKGTIALDPTIASAARGGVLFVMLKQGTADRGMPRAVYRVVDPTYPFDFDIGPEHVPLDVDNKADMLLGTLYATVRVDMDGNVMTKNPGDLEMSGEMPAVTAGSEAITLTLDEVRKS